MASRKERVPRFSVYQEGRGSEPMMVAGRILFFVAFSIAIFLGEGASLAQGAERSVATTGDAAGLAARATNLVDRNHDVGAGRTREHQPWQPLPLQGGVALAAGGDAHGFGH